MNFCKLCILLTLVLLTSGCVCGAIGNTIVRANDSNPTIIASIGEYTIDCGANVKEITFIASMGSVRIPVGSNVKVTNIASLIAENTYSCT